MDFTAWKRLQERLQAFEAYMVRRENVIRFLIGRFVLMLMMVLGFWVGIRSSL
jgi:uncharacterized membrane protein